MVGESTVSLICVCFLSVVPYTLAFNYTWLERNDLYDFVVSVNLRDHPSGVGILFDKGLVLTTATVVENYMYDSEAISIASIYGRWNKYRKHKCKCGTPPYRVNRNRFWMSIGEDGYHCPLHDLYVMHCGDDPNFAPEKVNATKRRAFSTYLARARHHLFTGGFTYAGFGYVDRDHVVKMDQLEVDWFGEGYRVDCDEFIPRDWGRFICLRNSNDIVGIQSGSPLIHNGLVYGLGCFSLQKGEESILVFTDIRGYTENMYYCIKRDTPNIKWWSKYWWVR